MLTIKLAPLLDEISFILPPVADIRESIGSGLLLAVHSSVTSVFSNNNELEGKLLFNKTFFGGSEI